MSQFAAITEAQKRVEESVTQKMDEMKAHLQASGAGKETVAKIAEEFRAFRELTYSMLKLLRAQINECAKMMDSMETRQRRKTLIFSGVAEKEAENCSAVIQGLISSKLALKSITAESIKTCHRLGSLSKERPRPILVRFVSVDQKSAVWRAKASLKGSGVIVREFLTIYRQNIFSQARAHFGIRSSWSQDGVIVIKSPDGSRIKITTMDELQALTAKYPKAQTAAATGAKTIQKS